MLLDVLRVEGPDCYHCPYGACREACDAECFENAEHVISQYSDEVCAFIIEPLVQAAAGMKIYSPKYLKKLRTCCDTHNIHIIADEIATGYGRTGKMFAVEHADISPDIMCISKGLTGGYMPMAIAVTTDKIYQAFYDDYSTGKAFMHSHTYCGNPLACSAAIEVLNIIKEDAILEKLSEKAEYFHLLIVEKLSKHPYVGEIRHIGLINAIELVKSKEEKEPFDSKHRYGYQIYKEALKQGLLLRPLGDVIYFNPPLTIEKTDMKLAVDICLNSINKILG